MNRCPDIRLPAAAVFAGSGRFWERMEINISQTIRKYFRKITGLQSDHHQKTKEYTMKDKELTAEKIRAQYEEQPRTGLDELKALDARVKKPARVFGYT